jgi:hypothetical protein
MTKVLVCTTLTTYAMQDPRLWGSWLAASQCADSYFAAIETDARGLAPFEPLVAQLHNRTGRIWEFRLDCGREQVTQANRQTHIATGQNLCAEYAMQHDYTHILMVGADTEPPSDVIPKLLEVDYPVVGAECPVYALSGPQHKVNGVECEIKLATGCMLIERSIFKTLRWAPQRDAGLSDDWHYQWQCQQFFGVPHVVRKDCVAKHYPEAINAVEDRYDTKVVR